MSKRQRRSREKQRRHSQVLPTKRQLTAAGGVALGASLITGATAQAATFNVTNLNDSGAGSFRAALNANDANNNQPTVDDIVFDSSLSGTIYTTGLYTFEPVNIQGPGAGQVSVYESGSPNGVFFTNQVSSGDPVTISGLTLYGAENAYGIYNYDASLTLNNTVVRNNGGYCGGGIVNIIGSLTLNSSTVSDNYAGDGGGICTIFGSTTFNSSTVSGNFAYDDGGGMYAVYGPHTFNDSTVSDNDNTGGDHGGGRA